MGRELLRATVNCRHEVSIARQFDTGAQCFLRISIGAQTQHRKLALERNSQAQSDRELACRRPRGAFSRTREGFSVFPQKLARSYR